MKPTTPNLPPMKEAERSRSRGFALIVSIVMMALLVSLGLAVLGLSRSEARKQGSLSPQAIARSNARLALNMALADLQTHLGPDQRTSATAAILDDNPFTEEIDGINNPHYLGAWRTDGLRFGGPNSGIIYRDGDSLTDRRIDNNTEAFSQRVKWLVSGDVNGTRDALGGQEGQDFVTLVRDLNTTNSPADVRVPLVPIMETDSDGTQSSSGSVGYWIGDEGLKAKLNLTSNSLNESPTLSDPTNGGYTRLLVPSESVLTDYWADQDSLSQQDSEKIISSDAKDIALGQVEPSIIGGGFHDVTTHSYSLLTNLRDGGLQQDMTAYLKSGGSLPALGPRPRIDDSLPIITTPDSRNTVSPRWRAFRDWYQLSDQVSGPLGNREMAVRIPFLSNGERPRLHGVRRAQITPVMTEAMAYLRHTFDGRRPVTLVYPRVVLWNPYNVKLRQKGYFVYFHFDKNIVMNIRYRNNANEEVDRTANLNYNFNYNNDRRIAFYIEPTELEPGEALVFTTAPRGTMLYDKAVPFSIGNNIRQNILSASSDPVDRFCFAMDMNLSGPGGGWGASLPSDARLNTLEYSYPQEIWWHGSNESQSIALYADNSGGSVGLGDLPSTGYPEISAIRFDNFSRGNNGRWGPVYTPAPQITQMSDAVLANPETLVHLGGRLRWMLEDFSNRAFGDALDEPWFSAPIAFGNARSPNHFRWLRDNMMGQRYEGVATGTGGPRSHLYSYGMVAQTRQAPDWLDPQVMPWLGPNGRYRTAVFQSADSANAYSTYPLFEIPDKDLGIFSIASLTHAQTSRYWWHPTYPIGNSLAPLNLPLNRTALSAAEESSEAQRTLSTLIAPNNDYIPQLSESGGDVMTTDLSFELNFELYDRFFLSNLPYSSNGWSGDQWPDGQPLPNPRLVFNHFKGDSNNRSEVEDFQRASSNLLIDGGFNINSVSVPAWTALLKSFRNLDMPTRRGSSYENSYVFSRLLVPENGGPGNADRLFNNAFQEDELWNGFRALTDEQVEDLAENIVRETKRRGPYLSMADFVNRRLDDDRRNTAQARVGALQAAIDNSAINVRLDGRNNLDYNLPDSRSADRRYTYGAEYWGGPTRTPEEQTFASYDVKDNRSATRSEAAGAPGYLMASDILQQIGSVLSGRSDTFTIRAYGDARDANGNVISRAYCEAVVQRTHEPINPDPTTDNIDPMPINNADDIDYGRRFKVISFRWLPNENI